MRSTSSGRRERRPRPRPRPRGHRRVGLLADGDAVAGVAGSPLLGALPVVEASLRRLFASTA